MSIKTNHKIESYNLQIKHHELQAIMMKVIWDTDGDLVEAAHIFGCEPAVLLEVFETHKTLVMDDLLSGDVNLNNKELAHMAWHRIRGIIRGLECWRIHEEFYLNFGQ